MLHVEIMLYYNLIIFILVKSIWVIKCIAFAI